MPRLLKSETLPRRNLLKYKVHVGVPHRIPVCVGTWNKRLLRNAVTLSIVCWALPYAGVLSIDVLVPMENCPVCSHDKLPFHKIYSFVMPNIQCVVERFNIKCVMSLAVISGLFVNNSATYRLAQQFDCPRVPNKNLTGHVIAVGATP